MAELSDFQFSDADQPDGVDGFGWSGDDADPLSWLAPILWPEGQRELQADERPGPGWWASPSAAHPHILIPCEPVGARRRAVRRYHDGFGLVRRMRSVTAEMITSIPGVAELALQGSKVVEVPGPKAVANDVTIEGGGVIDGLRELLGIPDLTVAVSLSVEKSNRKPVLQLLDGAGHCVGWAKVAWNPRTEQLVGNEALWLGRPTVAPLITPDLLHDVPIAGRRVVITSGVEPARLPRRLPGALPSPELFRAVAGMGAETTGPCPIEASAWWDSVQDVWDGGTARELEAIEAVQASCVGLEFEIGAWHGDLTPWNLMTSAQGSQLIDWEYAADGVPVGFDLCHFHTQVGSEMKLLEASSALDRSARLSPQGLHSLGIEPKNHLALYRLYLVELIRRSMELRLEGYPMSLLSFGPAALQRLERSAGLALGSGRRLKEVMLP